MKLVTDISYHNYISPEQWNIFGDILDGVIIRLSYGVTEDTRADDHVENATRVGLPIAGYHWTDPTWGMERQLERYAAVVAKFQPTSMFNDLEQYWTDWDAFNRQDYVAMYATRFTPYEINNFYRNFYNATRDLDIVTVGNYSAEWFMQRYAPQMREWVYTSNYWDAGYVAENLNVYQPSEVRAYAENININYGFARQFTSKLKVTGLPLNLDWNKFTDEGFEIMFNHGENNPDQPPDGGSMETNGIVLADVLNVRKTPTVNLFNKVGQFTHGTRVFIESINENMWGRVTYPITGYVSMGYIELDAPTPPPTPPTDDYERGKTDGWREANQNIIDYAEVQKDAGGLIG